jgi:acyl carrier protein
MESEIFASLAQFIARDILKQPKKTITGDLPLISTGLIDSLHLVDLSIYIEDQFGVRIDDAELNKETFNTLDQLVALIQQRKD